MTKYTCFGGVGWIRHFFSLDGNFDENGPGGYRGRVCDFYEGSLFSSKRRCSNKSNQNPSSVPNQDCDLYGSACFIATEIYGPEAEETNVLRAWRDKSLNTNLPGRLAVRTYYAISPEIVGILRKNPSLKKPIKSSLDHIVEHLKN